MFVVVRTVRSWEVEELGWCSHSGSDFWRFGQDLPSHGDLNPHMTTEMSESIDVRCSIV